MNRGRAGRTSPARALLGALDRTGPGGSPRVHSAARRRCDSLQHRHGRRMSAHRRRRVTVRLGPKIVRAPERSRLDSRESASAGIGRSRSRRARPRGRRSRHSFGRLRTCAQLLVGHRRSRSSGESSRSRTTVRRGCHESLRPAPGFLVARRDRCDGVRRRHHLDHLEADEIVPRSHPLLEQRAVGALHHLVAPGQVVGHPAAVVLEARSVPSCRAPRTGDTRAPGRRPRNARRS